MPVRSTPRSALAAIPPHAPARGPAPLPPVAAGAAPACRFGAATVLTPASRHVRLSRALPSSVRRCSCSCPGPGPPGPTCRPWRRDPQGTRRGGRRSGRAVAGVAGDRDPGACGPELAVGIAGEAPAALVDGVVVVPAQHGEVAEHGRPGEGDHVVGLEEPGGRARPEATASVSLQHDATHGRADRPCGGAHAHGDAGSVLDDHLDPAVAEQPPCGLHREQRAVLELGGGTGEGRGPVGRTGGTLRCRAGMAGWRAAVGRCGCCGRPSVDRCGRRVDGVEVGDEHHVGPVGVGVVGDGGAGQGQQTVGAALVRGERWRVALVALSGALGAISGASGGAAFGAIGPGIGAPPRWRGAVDGRQEPVAVVDGHRPSEPELQTVGPGPEVTGVAGGAVVGAGRARSLRCLTIEHPDGKGRGLCGPLAVGGRIGQLGRRPRLGGGEVAAGGSLGEVGEPVELSGQAKLVVGGASTDAEPVGGPVGGITRPVDGERPTLVDQRQQAPLLVLDGGDHLLQLGHGGAQPLGVEAVPAELGKLPVGTARVDLEHREGPPQGRQDRRHRAGPRIPSTGRLAESPQPRRHSGGGETTGTEVAVTGAPSLRGCGHVDPPLTSRRAQATERNAYRRYPEAPKRKKHDAT